MVLTLVPVLNSNEIPRQLPRRTMQIVLKILLYLFSSQPHKNSDKKSATRRFNSWWVLRDSLARVAGLWGIRSHPLRGLRAHRWCLLTHCQTPGFSSPNPHSKNKTDCHRFNSWWVLRDSNPRPSRCKRDALIN